MQGCAFLGRLWKVSRAVRRAAVTDAIDTGSLWPSQLLSALQQRAYIASAGASDYPPAFVFDIDGVLIRGSRVLEPAKKALARLYENGGRTPRYPICFLTNGGGMTEQHKADELSSWLGVQVEENQVVLSHTPFKSLVPNLGNQPVMVAGVGQVPEVAHHYGFKHTLTPADVARALPSAAPFWKDRSEQQAAAPGVCPIKNLGYGSSKRPIEAILVFKDPADWYLDLQIMTDVIMGGGVIRQWSPAQKPCRTVKVYFSNPDLLWAADHPAPRYGQGGFATALQALHKEVTGRTLECQFFGKPNRAPYELAEHLLYDQAVELRLVDSQQSLKEEPARAFGAIYAIGDNPKADIAGAKAQGFPWVSMLVRTGVFSGDTKNDEEHPADVVVDDVLDAVEAALHRTRSMRWHSMR